MNNGGEKRWNVIVVYDTCQDLLADGKKLFTK